MAKKLLAKTAFKPRATVRIDGRDFSMSVQYDALTSIAWARINIDARDLRNMSDEDWIRSVITPAALAARRKWIDMQGERESDLERWRLKTP